MHSVLQTFVSLESFSYSLFTNMLAVRLRVTATRKKKDNRGPSILDSSGQAHWHWHILLKMEWPGTDFFRHTVESQEEFQLEAHVAEQPWIWLGHRLTVSALRKEWVELYTDDGVWANVLSQLLTNASFCTSTWLLTGLELLRKRHVATSPATIIEALRHLNQGLHNASSLSTLQMCTI
jgi:hypothetical protein